MSSPAKPSHRFATEGGQPAAVRGERHPDHGPRVAVQDRHVLPARRPPHPDGPVGARRGDPLPVRAVRGGDDLAGMAVVRRFDLPARRGVPLAHRPVRRGRHEARAVRAEGDAEDLARVPPARGEQRAGGRVPQARRPVLAGRGEPRAVRAEGEAQMPSRWPSQTAVCLPEVASNTASRHHSPSRQAARQPRAVRAHDDGTGLLRLRHLHATKDLAGLVEQVEGRVPDPRHDPKSAAGLRGGDGAPALGRRSAASRARRPPGP